MTMSMSLRVLVTMVIKKSVSSLMVITIRECLLLFLITIEVVWLDGVGQAKPFYEVTFELVKEPSEMSVSRDMLYEMFHSEIDLVAL